MSWSIIYNKGYQKFDSVSSTVTSKVKGLGIIVDNSSNKIVKISDGRFFLGNRGDYRIFDVSGNWE